MGIEAIATGSIGLGKKIPSLGMSMFIQSETDRKRQA